MGGQKYQTGYTKSPSHIAFPPPMPQLQWPICIGETGDSHSYFEVKLNRASWAAHIYSSAPDFAVSRCPSGLSPCFHS